ncbi:DNA repair protein SWI5 homolog [Hypanus sabinus]|uniref:DNA repair protein SWI5 homolog n=1 Tax=Hypanus sabinus TaxID=79690 RepID=UPI0028C38725|nr:DNA repair protein SWI5 homolog [Hypanus sabinus]
MQRRETTNFETKSVTQVRNTHGASDWLLPVTCTEVDRGGEAVAMAGESRSGLLAVGAGSPSSGGLTPALPHASTPTVGEATLGRSLKRTPVGPSKKLNASFKSPLQSLSTHRSTELNATDLQTELANLKKKSEELDRQIAELISEGYTLEELDQHIDQLHEYNDIKDVGQILLGKLALVRGVTIKDLYGEFGLELDD